MDAAGRRMERRMKMLRSLTVERDRTGALYCCNECYTVGTLEHLGFDLETQRCMHCSAQSTIKKPEDIVSRPIEQKPVIVATLS